MHIYRWEIVHQRDVILISGRNEPVLAERSAYPAGKLLLD